MTEAVCVIVLDWVCEGVPVEVCDPVLGPELEAEGDDVREGVCDAVTVPLRVPDCERVPDGV